MMFGGSPMSVAVPPMLLAKICVMKYGTGLTSRILQIVSVIGAMSRTVVTLSKIAEQTAVISTNATMMRHGSPFAIFADLYARYSKRPDCFTTATNSIMPVRTPMVLKSIDSMPSLKLMMPVRKSSTAPASAADVRCTFSVTMRTITPRKMTRAIIWSGVIIKAFLSSM